MTLSFLDPPVRTLFYHMVHFRQLLDICHITLPYIMYHIVKNMRGILVLILTHKVVKQQRLVVGFVSEIY